eukprot:TRINITY_DN3625_c0_g1_i4.p1 TRINITY_DN3625_c0_g1~~TRINITY_DN3625_c0_g1_i4.p1  ORF type:complete len:141 (-),score=28.91 TRINITY_DN3625_c0_g1_i4:118-540(-)
MAMIGAFLLLSFSLNCYAEKSFNSIPRSDPKQDPFVMDAIKVGREIFLPLLENPSKSVSKEEFRKLMISFYKKTWGMFIGNLSGKAVEKVWEATNKMLNTYINELPDKVTAKNFIELIRDEKIIKDFVRILERFNAKTDL